MYDLVVLLVWMLFVLGVLIAAHEYGHYWMARRLGMPVRAFVVGFGRPIVSWTNKAGTRFRVGMVPLGGYVDLWTCRAAREDGRADFAMAYDRQSPPRRIALALAGPAANLVLAFFAFWLMAVGGLPDYRAIIDTPTGQAQIDGFAQDDIIVAVDGRHTQAWSEVAAHLGEAAAIRKDVVVSVLRDREPMDIALQLSSIGADQSTWQRMAHIGLVLRPRDVPPEIRSVAPGSAAAKAGLRAGDRVVSVNSIPVTTWRELVLTMQDQAAIDRRLEIAWARPGLRGASSGTSIVHAAQREPSTPNGTRYFIGIKRVSSADVMVQYGFLGAFGYATREIYRSIDGIGKMLYGMVAGRASSDLLGGPIGIAQNAQLSADMGFTWLLRFFAIVSLGLMVLNLLPIPPLDGGVALFDLIEWLKGSPVPDSARFVGQRTGFALLGGVMGLAVYNDIMRLIG